MRRAARVDINQAEIVEALRSAGAKLSKRECALIGSRRSAELNQIRLDAMPRWSCAHCGSQAPATVHQKRKTYCSKLCMATAYKERLTGGANPNFRNAGQKVCEHCGVNFFSYQPGRKFCSLGCRDRASKHLRRSAKKDANHDSVVARLEAGGAVVKDLSRAMFGVPDLLVWHVEKWHLVEVKNPDNYYGRKGLNKMQEEWANEWQGGPVYIVRTDADVDSFLIGELSRLESVGGYKPEQS